ncbi:MAG: OmpA family protein [Marinosulfonomonas sp.]|nr:OmpA family protein [Marinosulfonomonas sp.]
MSFRLTIGFALFCLAPNAVGAMTLEFPAGAIKTLDTEEPIASVAIATSVFANGGVAKEIAEGAVTVRAWKIPDSDLSTLRMISLLRDQLIELGFKTLVSCDTNDCGGFDFRYSIDLLPEPDMHVDLGDYRYLAMRRDLADSKTEFVSLMVSRSVGTGFIQLTHVGQRDDLATSIAPTQNTQIQQVESGGARFLGLGELLVSVGRAPLDDLSFQTGSSRLGDSVFASLTELAQFLNANPEKTVALVGHTDAEGSLEANIALSKKRATAVLRRLVADYGVPQGQLEAAGVGYLSPRSSNLTDEGRKKNRRVEVILTSTR